MLLEEAIEVGKMRVGGPPTAEELEEIRNLMIPAQIQHIGLRNPERDSKTDADFLRLSFKDEDDAWRAENERKSITLNEQKKLQREVLTDTWEEDMSLYKHKRKD